MASTRRRTRFAQSALALLAIMAPQAVFAGPQTLDCVLTDIEIKSPGAKFDSQVAAEKRSITVIFDDDAKSLILRGDGTGTPMWNVAISQTSMTGAANNISLGIDRSSWHIVFQTYGQGSTRNEFGVCSFEH
ncbi:MAG: hypothetical protein ACLPWS_14365 [Rhodomicrobium sp.]